jgi:hypothetical protein
LLTTWAGPGINIAEVTKKRNPVGNLDNVAFEKENMKQEVESYLMAWLSTGHIWHGNTI